MSIETDAMWEAYLSAQTPTLGEFGFKTELESAALAGRMPTIIAGGKDVFLETGNAAPVNSWLGPVIGLASQAIAAFAPQRRLPGRPGADTVEEILSPFRVQEVPPDFTGVQAGGSTTAGITTVVGGAWGRCALPSQARRRKAKVVMLPDGTQTIVPYCAPRRMNPLNPRALSRAARRIGSFHRIASGLAKCTSRLLPASRPTP